MLTMLKNWQGSVTINGVEYDSIKTAKTAITGPIHIKLCPKSVKSQNAENKAVILDDKEITITVKQYMTKKSSPEFDFMAKWNNDNPMPLRTMTGTVVKETKGMVYMKLYGFGEKTCTCMRCGKQITHPVSKFYGIGPECRKKLGIVADIDDIEGTKQELEKVEWEGWIIRSAITAEE